LTGMAGRQPPAVDFHAAVDRCTARDFDRLAQTLLFSSSEYRDRVDCFLGKN